MAKEDRTFESQVEDIQQNAQTYHDAFIKNEAPEGPTYHFHLRALNDRQLPPSDDRIEMVYAVLVSWSMNSRSARMVSYEPFKNSIQDRSDSLEQLKNITPAEIDQTRNWEALEDCYKNICVMKSKSRLVGHSKVLSHLLPDLVAPIDNKFTLSFLGLNDNSSGKKMGWERFKNIHQNFYYKVITGNDEFLSLARTWLDTAKYPWNTSILKLVDNLVMGKQYKAKT